ENYDCGTSLILPGLQQRLQSVWVNNLTCHMSVLLKGSMNTIVNRVIADVQQYQAAILDILSSRVSNVFDRHPEMTTQLQHEALNTFGSFIDPFSTIGCGQIELSENFSVQSTERKMFSMLNTVPQRSREGFFYDFSYGALFISHPLYSVRPNVFQIILDSDDIEICNP
ncbi:unnamed protein product, partial [Menidia menidia]